MDSLQYINANNENYMWLFDMEWLTADNILNYQYEEGENRNLVPFAHTGGGDKRAWFMWMKKSIQWFYVIMMIVKMSYMQKTSEIHYLGILLNLYQEIIFILRKKN